MKSRTILLLVLFLTNNWGEVLAQQSEAEWINVYFNMPAYFEPGAEIGVNDSYDLIKTFTDLVDSATTSIDLCIYDIEHPDVAEALIQAKHRGVRIRLITDNFNRSDGKEIDKYIWNRLGEAGIVSMDDDGDLYFSATNISDYDLVNDGADMHNKFAIFDYASPAASDDIVWTGSTNLTYTGAFNTNNVIVLKDHEIAEIYTQEFEQMWGGAGDNPNPKKARFHKDKTDVSDHIFDVNGTRVEVYFSPINRDRTKPSISERLVRLIEEEVQHDVSFQAFSITPNIPLSEALWNKSADGSVTLNGVIDPGFYARYQNADAIWGTEEARAGNRMVLPAKETRKLHHKVLVMDATNPDSNDVAVVVTGSYNFSNNAEMNNDENLIIIYSDDIAAQYAADFSGAMARAQEQMQAPAPPVDPDKWYNVYSIRDGTQFEIEVVPGFGYPVRLLGVDVPSIYAGKDSSEYYSAASAEYLRNLIAGRKVRVKNARQGEAPVSNYGAFIAYVDFDYDGTLKSLNREMLENGYGIYSKYYAQHPDSVIRFEAYEATARERRTGIWKHSSKIGTKTERIKEIKKSDATEVIYPININTADQATLQLLPGIGATYAQRIIDYRIEHGGFKRIEELINIKGIGEKRLAKIRPVITL